MKGSTNSLLTWEMQIKSTMRHYFHTHLFGCNKKTDNTKCLWELEKLELLYIADRNMKWWSHFGRYFGIPHNAKHRITMWSSNSIPRHLPKKIKKICPHRNLCIDVHSSIISKNRQEFMTTQMSISWGIDK